jgi:hypothetical protein
MSFGNSLRSLARRFWRVALPTLVVAGAAVTCDSPMSPHPAMISIAPKLDLASLSQFAGLTVDQVRVRIIRPGPPPDTAVDRIWPFSVDSTHLDLDISIEVTGTEVLDVVFDLMAGSQVVFTGTQQVTVTAGAPTPPTPLTPAFVGPGAQIGSLLVSPLYYL